MTLEDVIRQEIEAKGLMSKDNMYVVALSGGPDSVALLLALSRLGYNIEAAHCNFHLRGEESDRDEAFCKQICQEESIPLHIVHFDTRSFAELHKISIEMAARQLRYHWFSQLAQDIGAKGVCIAHHGDDQVETILLNIIRGTGLRGLQGMRERNGIFIRPMLEADEAQVEDYLSSLGQSYVVDSSNLEDDVQRNKLRLDILPLLEKINPNVKGNILRMSENLKDISAIVDQSLREAVSGSLLKEGLIYDMTKIRHYVAPRTLLWTILSPYNFNRTQVGEILRCVDDNKEWKSISYVAILSHNRLYIIDRKKWEASQPELRMPEEGQYRYGNCRIRIKKVDIDDSFAISKKPNCVNVDSSKVVFPLTVRRVKGGDRFTPYGMRGSKLVSDYLKDCKQDVVNRHRQLVITDGKGRIIWLVGKRIADFCKITSKTTHAFAIEMIADEWS